MCIRDRIHSIRPYRHRAPRRTASIRRRPRTTLADLPRAGLRTKDRRFVRLARRRMRSSRRPARRIPPSVSARGRNARNSSLRLRPNHPPPDRPGANRKSPQSRRLRAVTRYDRSNELPVNYRRGLPIPINSLDSYFRRVFRDTLPVKITFHKSYIGDSFTAEPQSHERSTCSARFPSSLLIG